MLGAREDELEEVGLDGDEAATAGAEPPAGPERTVAAILADPSLTPEQREALLSVYRSFKAGA